MLIELTKQSFQDKQSANHFLYETPVLSIGYKEVLKKRFLTQKRREMTVIDVKRLDNHLTKCNSTISHVTNEGSR